MRRIIVGLLAVFLVLIPGGASADEYSVQAGGYISVDCGQESFLTRLVVSPIGGEGSLLWVGGNTSSYLVVDRQGIVPSPITYNFGSVGMGSTVNTGLDYFTIKNNGEYTINIGITATNMTGGIQWTLSDIASPGLDIFGLKAGLLGGSYNVTVKGSNGNTLVGSLIPGGSQQWGLQLLAPTEFSDGIEKSGIVTLTAVMS
jgi:hypothetical protein